MDNLFGRAGRQLRKVYSSSDLLGVRQMNVRLKNARNHFGHNTIGSGTTPECWSGRRRATSDSGAEWNAVHGSVRRDDALLLRQYAAEANASKESVEEAKRSFDGWLMRKPSAVSIGRIARALHMPVSLNTCAHPILKYDSFNDVHRQQYLPYVVDRYDQGDSTEFLYENCASPLIPPPPRPPPLVMKLPPRKKRGKKPKNRANETFLINDEEEHLLQMLRRGTFYPELRPTAAPLFVSASANDVDFYEPSRRQSRRNCFMDSGPLDESKIGPAASGGAEQKSVVMELEEPAYPRDDDEEEGPYATPEMLMDGLTADSKAVAVAKRKKHRRQMSASGTMNSANAAAGADRCSSSSRQRSGAVINASMTNSTTTTTNGGGQQRNRATDFQSFSSSSSPLLSLDGGDVRRYEEASADELMLLEEDDELLGTMEIDGQKRRRKKGKMIDGVGSAAPFQFMNVPTSNGAVGGGSIGEAEKDTAAGGGAPQPLPPPPPGLVKPLPLCSGSFVNLGGGTTPNFGKLFCQNLRKNISGSFTKYDGDRATHEYPILKTGTAAAADHKSKADKPAEKRDAESPRKNDAFKEDSELGAEKNVEGKVSFRRRGSAPLPTISHSPATILNFFSTMMMSSTSSKGSKVDVVPAVKELKSSAHSTTTAQSDSHVEDNSLHPRFCSQNHQTVVNRQSGNSFDSSVNSSVRIDSAVQKGRERLKRRQQQHGGGAVQSPMTRQHRAHIHQRPDGEDAALASPASLQDARNLPPSSPHFSQSSRSTMFSSSQATTTDGADEHQNDPAKHDSSDVTDAQPAGHIDVRRPSIAVYETQKHKDIVELRSEAAVAMPKHSTDSSHNYEMIRNSDDNYDDIDEVMVFGRNDDAVPSAAAQRDVVSYTTVMDSSERAEPVAKQNEQATTSPLNSVSTLAAAAATAATAPLATSSIGMEDDELLESTNNAPRGEDVGENPITVMSSRSALESTSSVADYASQDMATFINSSTSLPVPQHIFHFGGGFHPSMGVYSNFDEFYYNNMPAGVPFFNDGIDAAAMGHRQLVGGNGGGALSPSDSLSSVRSELNPRVIFQRGGRTRVSGQSVKSQKKNSIVAATATPPPPPSYAANDGAPPTADSLKRLPQPFENVIQREEDSLRCLAPPPLPPKRHQKRNPANSTGKITDGSSSGLIATRCVSQNVHERHQPVAQPVSGRTQSNKSGRVTPNHHTYVEYSAEANAPRPLIEDSLMSVAEEAASSQRCRQSHSESQSHYSNIDGTPTALGNSNALTSAQHDAVSIASSVLPTTLSAALENPSQRVAFNDLFDDYADIADVMDNHNPISSHDANVSHAYQQQLPLRQSSLDANLLKLMAAGHDRKACDEFSNVLDNYGEFLTPQQNVYATIVENDGQDGPANARKFSHADEPHVHPQRQPAEHQDIQHLQPADEVDYVSICPDATVALGRLSNLRSRHHQHRTGDDTDTHRRMQKSSSMNALFHHFHPTASSAGAADTAASALRRLRRQRRRDGDNIKRSDGGAASRSEHSSSLSLNGSDENGGDGNGAELTSKNDTRRGKLSLFASPLHHPSNVAAFLSSHHRHHRRGTKESIGVEMPSSPHFKKSKASSSLFLFQ